MPNSLMIVTDMRKDSDVVKLVEKTVKKFGRVDILINNAGQGIYGTVEKINLEHYKEIMELNMFGVLRGMQAVIPQMRKHGGGMIVNVGSGVTKRYIPGISAYSSTKYALNALSFIARQELAKEKIIGLPVFAWQLACTLRFSAFWQRCYGSCIKEKESSFFLLLFRW